MYLRMKLSNTRGEVNLAAWKPTHLNVDREGRDNETANAHTLSMREDGSSDPPTISEQMNVESGLRCAKPERKEGGDLREQEVRLHIARVWKTQGCDFLFQ